MPKSRMTVIDIARDAGVSKSTVSLVLQGSSSVKPATRDKVTASIKKLGYVYNRGAANLRQSNAKSKIIGVIVNDLTNSFFAELAVGIDLVIQSADYVQFLSNSSESLSRQQELIASMREHGISGLIVSPAKGTTAQDFQPLVDAGIPVVLIVRNVTKTKTSTLMSDNITGVQQAAKHLLELGHTKISFLGGLEGTMVFNERSQALYQFMRDAGHEIPENYIIGTTPSRAGGVSAIEKALLLQVPPTAAICFNDAAAFGVCDGLRRQGKEPGSDFAVVGFDDVIEAKSVVPALTTISADPQGMGRRAANLLLKQINSESNLAEAVVTPVRLVIRESCGCAPNNIGNHST